MVVLLRDDMAEESLGQVVLGKQGSIRGRLHYLGFKQTVGRALRQVAEYRSHWLALLLWQSSALMCGPRDRWINWPRPIQFQRLHLIVNNARFLTLPGVQVPHPVQRVNASPLLK